MPHLDKQLEAEADERSRKQKDQWLRAQGVEEVGKVRFFNARDPLQSFLAEDPTKTMIKNAVEHLNRNLRPGDVISEPLKLDFDGSDAKITCKIQRLASVPKILVNFTTEGQIKTMETISYLLTITTKLNGTEYAIYERTFDTRDQAEAELKRFTDNLPFGVEIGRSEITEIKKLGSTVNFKQPAQSQTVADTAAQASSEIFNSHTHEPVSDGRKPKRPSFDVEEVVLAQDAFRIVIVTTDGLNEVAVMGKQSYHLVEKSELEALEAKAESKFHVYSPSEVANLRKDLERKSDHNNALCEEVRRLQRVVIGQSEAYAQLEKLKSEPSRNLTQANEGLRAHNKQHRRIIQELTKDLRKANGENALLQKELKHSDQQVRSALGAKAQAETKLSEVKEAVRLGNAN